MHATQVNILKSLQQTSSRKFTELLQDVAETSDNLTYHLKQLQKTGFIKSAAKGQYSLSQKGLIYLNNNLELGHELFPTLSCMLELYDADDRLLVMRKRKQPYLGSHHLPTFGITSSQALKTQIDVFLARYRIDAQDLNFHGVHRERAGDTNGLNFDKFFILFRGKFTSFEQNVDDREFVAAKLNNLFKDAQLLPASKAVLTLGVTPDFTEAIHRQV